MNKLKLLIRLILFPLKSLFDERIGFTYFYRSGGRWMASSRGRKFIVNGPNLEALEYFRYVIPAEGNLVYDVGGELGLETTQFSSLVGPGGKVIVFECFPSHVERLKQIASNQGNITVVERACWNKETNLTFHVGKTPGSNTAVPDARGQRGQELHDPGMETLTVQAETLDMIWERLTPGAMVDFLKMDIEGAEYEALDGAQKMLGFTKYAVIAAYHLRDGVPTAEIVARKLRAAGFEVRIDENMHVYATKK